jgi:ABC-type phosphate transport system auxiliary subunit
MAKPLTISASKIAALIGRSPFETQQESWVAVLSHQRPQVYGNLVRVDESFMTKHHRMARELKRMPEDVQETVKRVKKDAVNNSDPSSITSVLEAAGVSCDSIDVAVGNVRCMIGTAQESSGLTIAADKNTIEGREIEASVDVMKTGAEEAVKALDCAKQKLKEQIEITRMLGEEKVRADATTNVVQDKASVLKTNLISVETYTSQLELKIEIAEKAGEDTSMIITELEEKRKEKDDTEVKITAAEDELLRITDRSDKISSDLHAATQHVVATTQEEHVLEEVHGRLVNEIKDSSDEGMLLMAETRKCTETFKIPYGSIVLSGKIDGFKQHGNTIMIVEHKRRQNRLFRKVYDAERIQCVVYLYLVTRLRPEFKIRCMLSETFGDDCMNHHVESDDDLMESVLEYMDGVWKTLENETDVNTLRKVLQTLQPL